jgi:hypothetical protein
VRNYLQNNSPVTSELDGRISQGAAPAELPISGGVPANPWPALLVGLALLCLGLRLRRQTNFG